MKVKRLKLSYTTVLVRHLVFGGLLGGAASKAERMEIVKMARVHATMILDRAVRRIRVEKPSIIAAYKAKGLDPVWMLNDNDDAVRFWLTLSLHDHTPAEKEAADLLRSCVAADVFGDVPEFADMQLGKKFSNGRKLGTRGPVSKKIKAYMSKNPLAKADEVWAALKKSPPKGLAFMESDRFGRYIEKGCKTVMRWGRFGNLVTEHRPPK